MMKNVMVFVQRDFDGMALRSYTDQVKLVKAWLRSGKITDELVAHLVEVGQDPETGEALHPTAARSYLTSLREVDERELNIAELLPQTGRSELEYLTWAKDFNVVEVVEAAIT